jgi:hypothetical protein
VTASDTRGPESQSCTDEYLSELLHGMSQPLTTLECGLELAIRYDTTLAQVRHRLKVLLEAAQVLHQRVLELRMLQGTPALANCGSGVGLDKSSIE